MTVASPRKGGNKVGVEDAGPSTPDKRTGKGSIPKPRVSPRPSRMPSVYGEGKGGPPGLGRADSFIPILKNRKKVSSHARQNSAPNVYQNDRANLPSPSARKKEWIAGFDTLAGLRSGKIEVTLDCIDQFKAFLGWARGRTIHAIKLNDSLSGFERDLHAAQEVVATEKIRQQYAASPGIDDILEALHRLQSLDISRCDPSEPDLLKLLRRLKGDTCPLTSLQADWLYWGGREVVESLLSLIAGPTRLNTLSMTNARGYKLTPHLILTALRTNTGLKDVRFSVSGERGAVDPEDIALTIFMNASLKKLSISTPRFISVSENLFGTGKPVDFRVNDLVTYHFMSAFMKNRTLEELSIQGAPLPSTIIDAITESIGEHSAIRTVDLVESEENREAIHRLQALLTTRRATVAGMSARD